jgi:hypothetical protein
MQQKPAGSKAVDEGATILLQLSPTETWSLDAWIERHDEPRPTRSEAVHRLVLMGLCEHPGQ